MKYTLLLLFLCVIQILTDTQKESSVINFALSKVGYPYVYGTCGTKLTQSILDNLVARHGSIVHADKAKKYIGRICYDCAGLVAKAYNTVGISLSTGATSAWGRTNWAQKGEISNMPKDKVVILYKGSGTKMSHTGIYIKGNLVIHAKGIDYGVVKEPFNSNSWTHWGIPNGFYSGQTPTPTPTPTQESFPFNAKVVVTSGNTVNFRSSPKKANNLICRINKGETVKVTGEESGWYVVTYENQKGYIMKEFLVKV